MTAYCKDLECGKGESVALLTCTTLVTLLGVAMMALVTFPSGLRLVRRLEDMRALV